MTYWVFVMTGSEDELRSRIEEKKWPIFKNTGNKNNLKPDDAAIIYLGGDGNKKFVGETTVASTLQSDGESYWVELNDAVLWKVPVPMSFIITELEFIPNKKNWGAYLQGGIVWLPRNDYKRINEKSNRPSNTSKFHVD